MILTIVVIITVKIYVGVWGSVELVGWGENKPQPWNSFILSTNHF